MSLSLCNADLVPKDDELRRLPCSQPRISFTAAEYLKQKHRETVFSPLPGRSHDSVRHLLLPSVSSSSVFAEGMIEKLLGQVGEVSQLWLYLSSLKGGKAFSSSSSFSLAQRCPCSDFSQSMSSFRASCSSFLVSRSVKRPASPSPSRDRSPRPSY